MAEYRRFIAYFYEYIDGKKEKNAGFAKVELRNGMWRILFRLTTPAMPEPPVQVYGFVRERGYLHGLPMGTMRPGTPLMEEWAYRAETPVWERKYRLSDLAGIWIQSGDGRHYITVWDDDPISTEQFVLTLPEEPEEPEYGAAAGYGAAAAKEGGEQEPEQTVQTPEAVRQRNEQAEPMTQDAEQGIEQTEPMVQDAEQGNEQAEPMAQDAEQGIEQAEPMAQDAEQGIEQAEPMAQGTRQETAQAEPMPERTAVLKAAELLQSEQGNEKPKERPFCPSLQETLFAKRQRFVPFEDEEFRNCIQILPCDLVRLRQEGWQIGRSSFLLHGFYQYHHLLLGMTEEGNYVLGIPGIMNGQERYMARMFGFGAFKTARWRDQNRQFGYWYRIFPDDAASAAQAAAGQETAQADPR